jgi:hypothetical protein
VPTLSRYHRETLQQLQTAGATTVASQLCFLVPLARTGPRSKIGHCFDCDPDAKLPMPLGSRRECAKFRIPIGEYRAEKHLRRSLRYNPPQARNERQLNLVKGVCLGCKAFGLEGGGWCRSLTAGCRNTAYDRYHALLGDAHQWCPVWLEKLGLIRTVEEARERVDEFLKAESGKRKAEGHTGRGIVVVGGGEKYLPGTYVLLRMLRHLGCTLPVEVWHLGPREMPVEWGARLAQYVGHGGSIRDAYRVADKLEEEDQIGRASPGMPVAATLYGYEAKLFALKWNRFEEVLLLDADNLPVRDPTFLFDEPEYQRHGAVFWPDHHHDTIWYAIGRDTWTAFGIPADEYRAEREHETGQILADKRRCWGCLSLCNWYAQNGRNWYFKFQLGDKDVPHMAWRKLRQEFALVPHGPLSDTPGCLIQTDFAGQRLFQHRIGLKFKLPASANRHSPGFIGEDLCLGWLAEIEREEASGERRAESGKRKAESGKRIGVLARPAAGVN